MHKSNIAQRNSFLNGLTIMWLLNAAGGPIWNPDKLRLCIFCWVTLLGWGRNQRRNWDCEGRRRLRISRQVDAVTILQQMSTIVNNYQDAIRFQFHRLSVFEVIKQIVSCSHNKAKKHRSVGFQRLTPCREFPRIFSMSRIIYVCVEVLWSFRICNCFLLLPTHVSPLPLFLKLENRCSVRIPMTLMLSIVFVQQ